MSQREQSASKSSGKRNAGSKAGKAKAAPKQGGKRRPGALSTDPSTPKAKLQDKLREAEQDREYRSSRTKQVVANEDAPATKLDEVFDAANRHRSWAVPIIALAAAGAGAYAGVGTALLVLAGSVMLLVIATFWASVQSLTGETDLNLDEALSLAAPSAELEQKRAALRALKDLEFEHNIGKISDADYKDLSARYRADAKRLLQQLSDVEGESRKRAEELFNLKFLEMSGNVHLVDEGSQQLLDGVAPDGRQKVEEFLVDAVINHAKAKARGQLQDSNEHEENEAAAPKAEDDEASDSAEQSQGVEHEDGDDEDDKDEAAEDEAAEDEAAEPRDEGFVDDPVTSKQGVTGPSRLCKACKTRNILANTHCTACSAPLAGPNEILCVACPAVYTDSEDACPVCGVTAPVEQD